MLFFVCFFVNPCPLHLACLSTAMQVWHALPPACHTKLQMQAGGAQASGALHVLETGLWPCQNLACQVRERTQDTCSRLYGLSQTSSSLLQGEWVPQVLPQAFC